MSSLGLISAWLVLILTGFVLVERHGMGPLLWFTFLPPAILLFCALLSVLL